MTTNVNETMQRVLDQADPDKLADALRKMLFGRMQDPIKVVAAGLTAAAAFDITLAAFKALSTITGLTLATGENLPAIATVVSLRVVASGTATSLGTYGISDAGGTAIIPPGGASAAMGIALLSDDGKTLTFPNTVTAFTLVYRGRSATEMSAIFERS